MDIHAYCHKCLKIVPIVGTSTVKLRNGKYVHTGTCGQSGCGKPVMRNIYSHEMLVMPPGYFLPMVVFAGPKTPDVLTVMKYGQTINRAAADGTISEEKTQYKHGTLKTLSEITKGASNVKANPVIPA